ncbi:hypothetical protein ABMY28_21765 [Vibrio vulnificus]|uniref:hypothetical protein n=1 Tax=Vibrio vulnificus TaxID=672 RepID=UPI004059A4D0
MSIWGGSITIIKEVAYDYAKSSLDHELKRFDALDSKANKFLSLVSVVLGIFVSLIGWGFDKFFPPVSAMQCWVVFLLFLIALGLVGSWFKLFGSIRITNMPTLKLNGQACEDLCQENEKVFRDILKVYASLIEVHRSVMTQKIELVDSAYRHIQFSAIVTLVAAFFILISQL